MAESVLDVIFRGTDQTLSSTANSVGSSFSRLGGAVKAGLAIGATAVAGMGVAAVGLGSKLIGLGSDAEEMQGKFNVVFANTGDQVTQALSDFATQVGRSKFELMSMASTFGDTLKPMGFTEEAAADMSVQLSQLATDLGSFNNMEMDEALQRLQGTLIGSHENALAFGVIINENTLKAELAANGWDTLTGAALEQAKVQARINLLMKGTTDAQGDAARTSGSWANQMRALKSRITDFGTYLGGKLLPLFTPLLGKLQIVAGGVENFIKLIITAPGEGGPLLDYLQELPASIQPIAKMLAEFAVIFVDVLGSFRANLQEGMSPLNAFIEAIWDIAPPELLGNLIEFRDSILPNLIEKFHEIKNAVISFVEPIAAWIADNIQLKDVLIALAIVLGGIVLSALVSIATAIAPILLAGAALVGLVALVRTAWENNWGGIQEKTAAVWAFLQPIFQQVITWFQTNIPIAIEFLKNAWETVLLPAIQAVWGWLNTTLVPFISGVLVPWLQENIPAAIQVLTDFWQNTLMPIIQGVWEFLSVKMMPIWVALADFFNAAFTLAITALAGIWRNVLLPILTTIWEFIKDKLGPVFQWLKDSLIDPTSAAFQTLSSMIADLAAWISEVAQSLRDIELPDWMTPGSPTPWEIGLKGVRTQMAMLNTRELPGLQANLQGFTQSGNQSTVNNNQIFNWQVNTSQFNPESAGRAAAAFATGGI